MATSYWDGSSWTTAEAAEPQWRLQNADSFDGLLGVVGDAVVLVDGVSGEVLQRREVPPDYAAVWDVGRPGEQPEGAVGPPGGAVAIGGPADRPVAVACPSGPGVEEVRCTVFR